MVVVVVVRKLPGELSVDELVPKELVEEPLFFFPLHITV